MTIGEWLAERRPVPPPALRSRITAVLGGSLAHDATNTVDACLGAAERLVQTLLSGNSTTRDSALDLLTADALVTYAFEAAGEAPADLVERASQAMACIASIGAAAPHRTLA